jgi:non-specific serine/threonine protein kinase
MDTETRMLREGIRPVYASDECEIDLARRELRILGSPVPVGGRAFEIIETLAQSAGEIVSKHELINRVWPGAIVTENTLAVHALAIRKALGPYRSLLKTESGRGYRLLGEWTVRHHDAPRPPIGLRGMDVIGHSTVTNIPAAMTRLVGRVAAAQRLQDLVSAYGLVTLTGPGGIGKTSLALGVARRIIGDFPDGGWLTELASLSDPALVPSAVAGALGIKLSGDELSAEVVARAARDKHLLLVLDNCEHVIDAVANLTETFQRLCPHVTLVATSREALRVQGEYAYRVPPLEVPTEDQTDSDDILGYSAVELFIARTIEMDSSFSPSADELPTIATICRHLDGIPLAIEFAAARVAALGIDQLNAGLHDRFALLTSGRRTALPRHKTLRATLDWSYHLLPEVERLLLCRLAIFAGGFTLDAATAVASGSGIDASAVMGGIATLFEKSLLVSDKTGPACRWYLLETTRAYALDMLEKSNEIDNVKRLHARFFLDLFWHIAQAGMMRAVRQLDNCRNEVDNLRAALTWAFSPVGDVALGCELAAASMDFWFAAALLDECCEWATRAIAQIGQAAGSRIEMILQCGLGLALMHIKGMGSEALEALMKALSLASQFDDIEYLERATYGLWLFTLRRAQFRDSAEFSHQYMEIATRLSDPAIHVTANMMARQSHTILGEHLVSRDWHEKHVNNATLRFSDRTIIGHAEEGIGLWSRGLLDEAARAGQRAIEAARQLRLPFVLCRALLWPYSVFSLKAGYLDIAEQSIIEGMSLADRHAIRILYPMGLCAQGSLTTLRGSPTAGVELLRSGLAIMEERGFLYHHTFFLTELAKSLCSMGHTGEALVEIDTALQRATDTNYLWLMPEIMRTKGELLARGGPANQANIEALFRESLQLAARQQALYWELRTAVSLADLLQGQGKVLEARAVLGPVYDRFTEGFNTADLKAARALLDSL